MAARRKYVLRKFKTALLSRDAAENADPRAARNIPDSSCATPFNSELSVSLP